MNDKIASPNPLVLSIVVPFYNEEQNVLPMVKACLHVLEKMSISFEMVLVDDGSTFGIFFIMLEFRN